MVRCQETAASRRFNEKTHLLVLISEQSDQIGISLCVANSCPTTRKRVVVGETGPHSLLSHTRYRGEVA